MATQSSEEPSLRSTLLSTKVGRGLLARCLFTAHATLCVFKVAYFVDNTNLWLLLLLLGAMYVEFIIVAVYRKGKEWKWFFACILCYLMVTIPALWLLEVEVLNSRMNHRMSDNDDCGVSEMTTTTNGTLDFLNYFGLDGTAENWSLILQQLLIFVLIIGRWILPRGNITGDQLSQLLLVYIGSGADILEFASEGLRLDEIKCDTTIIYAILTIWTISLLQFTLPLTVRKRRRPNLISKGIYKVRNAVATCCATEIWSILVTVLTQDGPFLVVRMYLLIHKNVINELLLFFACKNILTILLQGNRLRALMNEKLRLRRSRRNRFALRWVDAAHIRNGDNQTAGDPDDVNVRDDECSTQKTDKLDIESGTAESQNVENGSVHCNSDNEGVHCNPENESVCNSEYGSVHCNSENESVHCNSENGDVHCNSGESDNDNQ